MYKKGRETKYSKDVLNTRVDMRRRLSMCTTTMTTQLKIMMEKKLDEVEYEECF